MDPLMLMSMFGHANNITRWCERFPTWDFSRRAAETVGMTALGFAILMGPNKLEAVKALVKAGANPLELLSDDGATGLHHVAVNKGSVSILHVRGVRQKCPQK